MPTMTIDHKDIFYNVVGTGAPLLLIHSGLLDSRSWEAHAAFFAPHYQVITVDLYGNGQSPIGEGKRMDYPGDLKALLNALHLESVHVVGVSMGAETALSFALAFPQAVRSLVLVGVALEGYDYPEGSNAWWGDFIGAVRANDFDTARTIFLQDALDSKITPLPAALRETIHMWMQAQTFQLYQDGTLIWPEEAVPLSERLNEITCPVLLMLGEGEQPIYNDMVAYMLARLPNASSIVIEGAGHLVHLQQPDKFNQAVMAFLAQASTQKA